MRTTINIDERLLKEAMKETGERNRGRVVNQALDELVRRRKIERLLASRGKYPDLIDRSEWHDLDLELELEHRKQA